MLVKPKFHDHNKEVQSFRELISNDQTKPANRKKLLDPTFGTTEMFKHRYSRGHKQAPLLFVNWRQTYGACRH